MSELLIAASVFAALVYFLGVDLVITATSVKPGTTAKTRSGIAGVAITAGQTVYVDPTTGTVKLADANAGGYAVVCAGIALHAASADQPVTYQYAGKITIGATVALGVIYCVSDTAGGIMPSADISTGEYPSLLGVAISTTQIEMFEGGPWNAQIAAA